MAEIQKFLSGLKGKDGNSNLYDHITNILGKMLLDNPTNPYDNIESYSHDVKFSNFDYKKDTNFDHKERMRETYGEIKEWADKALSNLEKINVGSEEEPQDPGQCGYVPNLPEEMKKFEWAGIYFGEEETYQLQKSLTKLAHQTKAKSLKLWGKILGSEKDYYVVEADGAQESGEEGGAPPEEPPADAEPKGTGVNKFSYFVANTAFGPWVELPVITPKHVLMARKIKHIFTGNLEANIITNPFFFGKEKHYLKAQIVRIAYNTGIVPGGLYKITEEENSREIEYEEEGKFVFPTPEQALNVNSWVHFNTNILKEGKTVHSEAPEEVEDKEVWLAQRQKQDPFEPRLKPLGQDRPPAGYRRAWSAKCYGDTIQYDTVAKDVKKTSYAVVALKSHVWPGLSIVIADNAYQSIYVGYGFKAEIKSYFPTFTKTVRDDPEDPDEQPEPSGVPPKEEVEGGNVEGGEGAGNEPEES